MFGQFLKPFSELRASPRGLWYITGAFVVESSAYFGILTLMTTWVRRGLHAGEHGSEPVVAAGPRGG